MPLCHFFRIFIFLSPIFLTDPSLKYSCFLSPRNQHFNVSVIISAQVPKSQNRQPYIETDQRNRIWLRTPVTLLFSLTLSHHSLFILLCSGPLFCYSLVCPITLISLFTQHPIFLNDQDPFIPCDSALLSSLTTTLYLLSGKHFYLPFDSVSAPM